MKNQILILTLGISLISIENYAQHHGHGNMQKDNQHPMTMLFEAPELFQEQLSIVVKETQNLKEAFIASDLIKIKSHIPGIEEALNNVDMNLLKGDAHMHWMNDLKSLSESLTVIKSAESLKEQRLAFGSFNEGLYKSIKAYGINGNTVYYQFCPMAKDGEGAYWLSQSEQIRNPYYGTAMLTCGSTKEILN